MKSSPEKIKVFVLGANGMLGHMMVKILKEDPRLKVVGTARSTDFHWMDIEGHYTLRLEWDDAQIEKMFVDAEAKWVINCTGIIKSRINEASLSSVRETIEVNSVFPHRLAALAERNKFNVIQIATDCVYSGKNNEFYTEDYIHDPTDIYGKTKSLGEVVSPRVCNLRCSIIGPELPGRRYSLLEWVRQQPQGATVPGYTNHHWNGITTEAFAKVCRGIIHNGVLPESQHLVPRGVLSKYELVNEIAEAYWRKDITVTKDPTQESIHRVLDTKNIKGNKELWEKAGYLYVPGIRELIEEMSALC
jgi:dTDP-4-dehydrorhamnose reductase